MSIVKSTPINSMEGAYDVSGKNVIVTGGAHGLGWGISLAFAQAGANVAIFCRNVERGAASLKELQETTPGTHACIACDVSSHESVIEAKKQYFEVYDHVDVLVNNAGVDTSAPFLSEEGLDEWYRVIGTDLHGVAHMVYEFAPSMVERKHGGTIINISSTGAVRTPVSDTQHLAPYNVAKAGVDIFSRYLAVALSKDNIRTLSIQPGPIHSDLDAHLPQSAIDAFEQDMPAHRFGEPIELGAFCVYLSSPAASFIRGANIPFDGGLLCIM